jgi:hypothetical protein
MALVELSPLFERSRCNLSYINIKECTQGGQYLDLPLPTFYLDLHEFAYLVSRDIGGKHCLAAILPTVDKHPVRSKIIYVARVVIWDFDVGKGDGDKGISQRDNLLIAVSQAFLVRFVM